MAVLQNAVSIPSRKEWDQDYAMRLWQKRIRKSPMNIYNNQRREEQSIVGWSLWFPFCCSELRPMSKKCIFLINVFHLALFPMYVMFRMLFFLIHEVHEPLWHYLITSGSYLMWRELVGLPVRRRWLRRNFVEGGIQVAAQVVAEVTENPERSFLKLQFSVPQSNQKGAKMIVMEVHVGNITSLYTREEPLKAGDSVDLVVYHVQPIHDGLHTCQIFTWDELQVQVDQSLFIWHRSALSLIVGIVISVIGTALYVGFVVFPIWFLPVKLAASHHNERGIKVLEILSHCWDARCQSFLGFMMGSVGLSIQLVSALLVIAKLCSYFNCAEYNAEEQHRDKQQVERVG
jgi:hypothetical protein